MTPCDGLALRTKASSERSMRRPPNGPRSLITTVTDLPFVRFATVTWVPKGSHGLAAVIAWLGAWYQVASPSWTCLPPDAEPVPEQAAAPRSGDDEAAVGAVVGAGAAPTSWIPRGSSAEGVLTTE